MSNTISAAVSESFELAVSPSEGFTGEHNAEMLEINISSLVQGGYDYYVIIFDDMSVNGVRKSNEIRGSEDYPAYLDGKTIFCPLSSQLTSTGKLNIQIEAHKLASNSSQIKKTSVASIEFKPSIMSGTDKEFDSSSLARLDNIELSLKTLEAQLKELSTIPLATAESIGGIRLSGTSPVQLDENGAAIFDYSKHNSIRNAVRMLFELLSESDTVQTLYVKNCEDDPEALDALTFELNVGNCSCVLFFTETAGKANYCDGNYDNVEFNARTDIIYMFKGQESNLSIAEYNRFSFRKLLLEGVV